MDETCFEIDAAATGLRLDRYLRKVLPAAPLSLVYRLLRQGRVRVDGSRAAPGLRLQPGMRLSVDLDEERLAALRRPRSRPVQRPARTVPVVYRDEHLLALDKPAGMAAQPGTGVDADNLVAWLLAQDLPRSAAFTPAPAHRIDRATSGLVLVGLSPEAQRGLAEAFRSDRVGKTYLAWVHGVPSPERGVVQAPLRRVEARRGDRPKAVVDPAGQSAWTGYEVEEVRGGCARLRISIRTGRMHQIRAHLAHLGHPVVGDRRYGAPPASGAGILLHAAELALEHPVTGKPLRLQAPPPPGFGPATDPTPGPEGP